MPHDRYPELLVALREGLCNPLDVGIAALETLTLANVHVRMGVPEVRAYVGREPDWPVVASGGVVLEALVLRTWLRAPPGGWGRAPSAWSRLLGLEAAARGQGESDDEDLRDPLPLIRCWAVLTARGDLAPLLTDPDPDVRLLVAARLWPAPAAVDAAAALVELRPADAVALLATVHAPAALSALLSVSHRADALAALAYEEALPVLGEALQGPRAWAACGAVERLGPRAAPLRAALVDVVARETGALAGGLFDGPPLAALTAIGPPLSDADAARLLRLGPRASYVAARLSGPVRDALDERLSAADRRGEAASVCPRVAALAEDPDLRVLAGLALGGVMEGGWDLGALHQPWPSLADGDPRRGDLFHALVWEVVPALATDRERAERALEGLAVRRPDAAVAASRLGAR